MKRPERRTRVGAEGGVPSQPGPGRPPGYQDHRRSLHPWVGRIYIHIYGHANKTLQLSGGVLPGVSAVCDRGNPAVRPERRQLSAGDGSVAVVSHQILSHP